MAGEDGGWLGRFFARRGPIVPVIRLSGLIGVGIDDRSVDSVSDYAGKMAPGASALLVTDARGFDRLKPELGKLGSVGVQASPVITPPGRNGYGAYRLERKATGADIGPASSVAFGRGGLATYAASGIVATHGDASEVRQSGDGSDARQAAPKPAVPIERFASSLVNPRGLAFRADGNLFVALAGNGGPETVDVGREKPHHYGRSGQVYRINANGDKFSMAKNLPSIVTAVNEECGPSAIAFVGDRAYILLASGGWEIGDPAYHSGVYELLSDGSLKQIWDMTAHVLANPGKARREDPRADVPAGMAYGMAALDGKLYVTDANQEQLFEVDPTTGAARRSTGWCPSTTPTRSISASATSTRTWCWRGAIPTPTA